MLKHASTDHLNFGTTPIQRSNLIKYLGGHLDTSLTFKEHVKQKHKADMLNFIKIKVIRPNLTTVACHTLVLMLCISHLDYANALLYGMTKKLKLRYQRIQNMCAELVLNKQKYDSATECLLELHWLPIEQRIEHKILLITHKVLNGQAPRIYTGTDKDQDTLQTAKIWTVRKTLVHTKPTERNICFKVLQLCCSNTMESPATAS